MFSLVQKSTTTVPLLFFMVQSSDHITALAGASPTVTISKNGAAFGSPSGAVTEIANGWYQVAGNATDTGTYGPIALHATAASGDPSDCVPVMVVGFDPSVANLAANVTQINAVATASVTAISANLGTTQPLNFTGTGASALVKSDMVDIAGAAVSATTAQIGVNVVNIAGTASQGAAGYVGTDQSKITNPTATVDLSGTTIKNLDNTPPGGPGTAAQIATAVWTDTTASDFTAAASPGISVFTGVAPGAANGLVKAGSNASITTTSLVLGAMSIGGIGNVAQTGDVFATASAEPTSVPAANASLASKIAWIYLMMRNKITTTASLLTAFANDGTTVVGTAAVSDDGTTATRGKIS